MPLPAPSPSAVADAYTRLTEVFPGLAVMELGPGEPTPDGDGWIPAAGLAEGGSALAAFLAWDEAFRELSGPDGEPLPTRDRASCCLFYTLRPEETCVTCPRTCDADRVVKLATATAG